MTAVKLTDANLDKLKRFKLMHKKAYQKNINFQDMVNTLIEKANFEDVHSNRAY